MLVGRPEECARVEALLDAARGGRAGALVLRGEAGIGKSAMLEWAGGRSGGVRVLRAAGVESEAELPCAGLHQLLRPLLPLLGGLPAPQRAALRAALALDESGETDRFGVYVATLGLLAAGAESGPLLCLVDDAHWLDVVSAEALVFAARRLDAEPVAMLFAARTGERAFVAESLPEWELARLGDAASRTLLDRSVNVIADDVAAPLLRLADGNPLALLELPRSLSGDQLGGRAPLDDPVAVSRTVEAAFLSRVRLLSPDARWALLLAAADGGSGVATGLLAGEARPGLEAAEAGGLVSLDGPAIRFRHPLVRAAAYQAATSGERRRAHRALADMLGEDADADERAHHLAVAADGPDEHLAGLLVAAADRAGRRGSMAARASALARAAGLTPDRSVRCRRLLDAATAAFAAGQVARVPGLTGEAAELADGAALRSEVAYVRWDLQTDTWAERYPSLVRAAEEVAGVNPHRAALMLSYAGHYLYFVGRVQECTTVNARAWELLDGQLIPGLLSVPCDHAWMLSANGRRDEACDLALSTLAVAARSEHPGGIDHLGYAADVLIYADHERARDATEALVARSRERGALPGVCTALRALADLELREGRLAAAYRAALEAFTIGELVGGWRLQVACAVLARVEAALGQVDGCVAHVQRAGVLGSELNLASGGSMARALGQLALAHGRFGAALEHLERAAESFPTVHPAELNGGIHTDLLEVLIRLGHRQRALQQLALLEAHAASYPFRWLPAAIERCRLLLVRDDELDGVFEAALGLLAGGSPFEEARISLVYGERWRRAARRVDARPPLVRAAELFEREGAGAWAERARRELAATGQRVPRREPSAMDVLTPQELQIALAVADGGTNREVGAALFISPKTVELHLSRVYRKLGLRSRTELARLLATRPDALVASPP